MADSRIDELRKRLEKEPGSRLFAQLAEELRKAGELDEAIRVCRDGLQKQPTYHSAHMTLARSLLDSGDLDAARPEFEAVLKAAPDNILASRLLGECLEGLGDLAGARSRYKTTLALAPVDKQLQSRLEAVEARLAAPAVSAPVEPPAPPPPMSPATPPLVSEAISEPQFLDFEESPPAAAEVQEEFKPIPLVAAEESFELEAAYEAPATRVAMDPPAGSVVEVPLEPATPAQEIDQEFVDFEAESAGRPEPIEVVARVPLMEVVEAPPPLVAPAPPAPAAATPGPVAELASATLGELYSSQGHPDKAIEVYRQVVEREPANERARARLAELVAAAAPPEFDASAAAAASALSTEARRAAIWRTIRHLEGMLAAVRRG